MCWDRRAWSTTIGAYATRRRRLPPPMTLFKNLWLELLLSSSPDSKKIFNISSNSWSTVCYKIDVATFSANLWFVKIYIYIFAHKVLAQLSPNDRYLVLPMHWYVYTFPQSTADLNDDEPGAVYPTCAATTRNLARGFHLEAIPLDIRVQVWGASLKYTAPTPSLPVPSRRP